MRRRSTSELEAVLPPDEPSEAPEESGAFVSPRMAPPAEAEVGERGRPRRPAHVPSLVVPPLARPPTPRPASVARPAARGAPAAAVEDDGPPSGRMLEIDPTVVGTFQLAAVPSSRRGEALRARPVSVPRPGGTPITPVGHSDVQRRADALDPRRPGIFAFAGYGLAPETLAGTPAYALRVLARRRVLARGLASARRRGSPDVALYQAALEMVHAEAYAKGIAVLAAGLIGSAAAVAAAFELLR